MKNSPKRTRAREEDAIVLQLGPIISRPWLSSLSFMTFQDKRTKTGEKPYEYRMCDRRFTQSSNLDENASVVLVDWSKGCGSLLGSSTAAASTCTFARTLALLVKTLADAGAVVLQHVHYIGHSLGAQTGGFFGKDVKQLTVRLVGRITGVRRPPTTQTSWTLLHTSVGSGWTDAVQGRMSMHKSCGHVDFYPNGGKQQPGCWKFSCECIRVIAYRRYGRKEMA
ncbi:hypothetical protein HPB50_019248 [Hyalomma asiaticum]|uniref:Uncharacterized protein n=1 Tax=Hyalomma asiaticum TaxID=266040 RepID=A0ACB7T5F1_HYAAI|nr:hypothetical protein HPB50_019248 [Hyalomma asiaticum]